MSSSDILTFGVAIWIAIALKPHEWHWIAVFWAWKNAVSLAVSVDEVHELSNFSKGVGFEPVFSLNLFAPFFHSKGCTARARSFRHFGSTQLLG
jgi:hypothetical protein